MKRKITLMLAVMLAFFSLFGCKSNQKSPDYTGGLSCDVAIRYGEMDIAARLEHTAAGMSRLTVQNPDSLSGMEFRWENSQASIAYKGLKFDLSTDSLPETAFAAALMNCLDNVALKGALRYVGSRDGWDNYEGVGDSGAYTLAYDSKTRRIASVTMPSLDLSVQFHGDEG